MYLSVFKREIFRHGGVETEVVGGRSPSCGGSWVEGVRVMVTRGGLKGLDPVQPYPAAA